MQWWRRPGYARHPLLITLLIIAPSYYYCAFALYSIFGQSIEHDHSMLYKTLLFGQCPVCIT